MLEDLYLTWLWLYEIDEIIICYTHNNYCKFCSSEYSVMALKLDTTSAGCGTCTPNLFLAIPNNKLSLKFT